MAIERWRAFSRFVARWRSSVDGGNWEALERLAPVELVVEDTGTAGTVQTLRHGLGRVPRGVLVINSAVAGAGGPVGCYRDVDDDAWTETVLTVRFNVSNAAVRLLIL